MKPSFFLLINAGGTHRQEVFRGKCTIEVHLKVRAGNFILLKGCQEKGACRKAVKNLFLNT